MAVEDHPVHLLSEKHHAFAEKVASYVAVIINSTRVQVRLANGTNLEEESVGVGSACLWKGQKIIVTAKHVVDGADGSDLRFFFRQGGKIDWQVKPNFPNIGFRIALDVERIIRSNSEDLAAIVLAECPEHLLDSSNFRVHLENCLQQQAAFFFTDARMIREFPSML